MLTIVKYYADQRFIGQLIARREDSCRHYTRLHIATHITIAATCGDDEDTDDYRVYIVHIATHITIVLATCGDDKDMYDYCVYIVFAFVSVICVEYL